MRHLTLFAVMFGLVSCHRPMSWIEYGGVASKTTILDVAATDSPHPFGFRDTFFIRSDEGWRILGHGMHPMEHLEVVKQGDYEPSYDMTPRWIFIGKEGPVVDIELKLINGFVGDERLAPEDMITFTGRAVIGESSDKDGYLSFQLPETELREVGGSKKVVSISGVIYAKPTSMPEFKGLLKAYMEHKGYKRPTTGPVSGFGSAEGQ